MLTLVPDGVLVARQWLNSRLTTEHLRMGPHPQNRSTLQLVLFNEGHGTRQGVTVESVCSPSEL